MARLLFSCPVRSDSWWPHGLQHARPPCLPSLSLVRVCRKTDSKGEDFQNVCDLWLRKCRNYTSRNYPKEWNDHQYMWTLFFLMILFFFVGHTTGLQDLSYLTKDWTCAPCSGSKESLPLDCQGVSYMWILNDKDNHKSKTNNLCLMCMRKPLEKYMPGYKPQLPMGCEIRYIFFFLLLSVANALYNYCACLF